MNCKALTLLIFTTVCCTFGYAQDYEADFREYFARQDTLSQKRVLIEWEASRPEDPQLYVSYFNYYFNRSRNEQIGLTRDEAEGENFIISDSTGQEVGFLGSHVYYDETLFEKGIEYINKGITLFPNRLDLRFGKIYAYGEKKDWTHYVQAIKETVAYSAENDNQWIWKDNTKEEGKGREGFLGAIQNYQVRLYNTGDDTVLPHMKEIAEAVLTYYPDDIMSLSNLSIVYMIAGEYENAVGVLLKAEKLNPEDEIVLSNIANAYRLSGENEKAIAYYEKTIKHSTNPRTIEFARQQIELLKE